MRNELQRKKESLRQVKKEYEYYKDTDDHEAIKLLEAAIGRLYMAIEELEAQDNNWCPMCGKAMEKDGEVGGMPAYYCPGCDTKRAADVIGEMKAEMEAERAQMASMER